MSAQSKVRRVTVAPSPNGDALEINCELETGRKLHQIPSKRRDGEAPPHGAGSFHDPEQHAVYMDRVEALLREG